MTREGMTAKERRGRARAARRYARILDDLRGESGLPAHLAATLGAAALGDVIALLRAPSGEAPALLPAPDDEALARDRAASDGDAHRARRRPAVPHDVAGEAIVARSRLASLAHADRDADFARRAVTDASDRTELVAALGAAHDLALAVAAHVRVVGASSRARAIARWTPRIARGAAVLLPIAAIITYFAITRPLEPIDIALDGRTGGITGTYYADDKFGKKIATRVDKMIQFDFGGDGALAGTGSDGYSIRWEGYVRFNVGGPVALCVRSDDGSDLHFNGRHIVDNWGTHPKTTRCGRVRVRPGWYPIRVDYNEVDGDASVALLRGLDLDSARAVPAADLCCRR